MRFHPCNGARVLVAAMAIVCATTAAFAGQQTLPAAPAMPGAQASEPTGPVRPLSIDEAVQLALRQNLGIQVERLNPQLQDFSIAQALSNYAPVFGGGVTLRKQQQPPSSFLSGGETTINNDSVSGNAQVSKFFKYGTNATVAWDSSRATTNNIFSSFNPTLSGNVDLTINQPLLRNFKFDTVRQQVYSGRKNREIADVDLEQTIASTTRQVKNAYWDYVYALNSLGVARQSLDLAQRSLQDTKTRVEIGTLAPIDVVQAESEVASREEAVITAEAAIGQTEDQLRTLIFDPKTPDFWQMQLKPTDTAPFQLQAVDTDGAVSRALNERTDLISARKRLEVTDYNLKYYKNQTLPSVNLQFNYNSTGLAGTQFVREGAGFPPPIVGTAERSYWDLMRDVLKAKFPTWQLGVNVTYPIGNSNADASLARAMIAKSQSDTTLRELELQVTYQVRDSARTLLANSKRVDATKAARVLAERRLEAEEKKFAAGMSTSFEVFQAQRDLAQARSNELRAVLDYNKSQVDFETVQVAPVNGGGALSSSAGATTLGGAATGAAAGAVSGAAGGATPQQ
jgi:outer membrane protein